MGAFRTPAGEPARRRRVLRLASRRALAWTLAVACLALVLGGLALVRTRRVVEHVLVRTEVVDPPGVCHDEIMSGKAADGLLRCPHPQHTLRSLTYANLLGERDIQCECPR